MFKKSEIKSYLKKLFGTNEEFKVRKLSGKPFKSGLKENTVIGKEKSKYVEGKEVYIFKEDDSRVAVDACEKV